MTVQRQPRTSDILADQVAVVQSHRLDRVPLQQVFQVHAVLEDPRMPDQSRQLEEIGFLPGEQVMLMTRGVPGGDPLVVRIGQSTFALRSAEAACIHVLPAMPRPAA